MKNRKLLLTISTVAMIAILIVTSTFAYLQWASSNSQMTNVSFTTGPGFSCSIDGGGDITSNDIELIPAFCGDRSNAIKREITINVTNNRSPTNIYLDLWLNVKTLTSGLENSMNFKYVLTDNEDACDEGTIIASNSVGLGEKTITMENRPYYCGGGNCYTNDKIIPLLQPDIYSATDTRTYYLYIWLDYNGADSLSQDQEFNFELKGSCTDKKIDHIYDPNPPFLVEGLIPVVFADGTGATVSTLDNTNQVQSILTGSNDAWYDYDNQKWGNAVLVKKEGIEIRDTYLNYSPITGNIDVNQEDILAYYVWIPRYSYKVWQYSGVADTVNEQEIEIKFIPTNVKETASKNGEWQTHPAFTFGDRELPGIWVGKFETSHDTLALTPNSQNGLGTDTGNTICNSNGCDSYKGLRILPNVTPLSNNRISNFFYSARFMESANNPFGLRYNKVDTHIIKNTEWGAVAYLSHSQYGIDEEVRINNYNSYGKTGCGAETANAGPTSTCSNVYGTVSSGVYPQSTTGNVTGVFDMSGGLDEYVMGHWGTTTNYGFQSGFDSTHPLPDVKYYDNYSSSIFTGTYDTNFNFCTLDTCGGHALNETKLWYSDSADFYGTYDNNDYIWLTRGGFYGYGTNGWAGLFALEYDSGIAATYCTSRLVLVPDDTGDR